MTPASVGLRVRSGMTLGRMPEDPGVAFAFSGREAGNCSLTVGQALKPSALANDSRLGHALKPSALANDSRLLDEPTRSRELLLAAVGLRPAKAVFMQQVHGPRVARVGRSQAAQVVPEVDALITTEEGLGLVVLVADCVPLLLAAPGRGVAAVHAGRNGVVMGVVAAAVDQLANTTATDPGAMVAILGPAIGGCCYEVPAELADEVGAVVPATIATTTGGGTALDLPAGVVAQVRAAGVGRLEAVEGCTRCDPDSWFSHRAATAGLQPHGRQAGVIGRIAAPPGAQALSFLH